MAIFSSSGCKIFLIPSLPAAPVNSCVGENYENKSSNYCNVRFQVSKGRGIKSTQVMSCFVDGNCNIITEILIVIDYFNITGVTNYCPTLVAATHNTFWDTHNSVFYIAIT